jgi:hypothetical protein
MKKWFLLVPFLLVAIRWVAIESFERYSEVPVCEAEIDGRETLCAVVQPMTRYLQVVTGS